MNIDGINIYTKTMRTCDEDLAGQIYVGREELKVRSISMEQLILIIRCSGLKTRKAST